MAYPRCPFGALTRFAAILAIIGSLGVSGCSSTREPADRLYPYYLDEMMMGGKGVVYVYEPVSSADHPVEYWHFRYAPGFRGNFLHATLYDQDGLITQRMKERFTTESAELMELELTFLEDDVPKSVIATITARRTFPFAHIDSAGTVTSQFEYVDTSADTVRVILTRHRTPDERMTYTFNGVQVPAVKLQVREVLETETEGFTETPWQGEEIYCQHVGLVYYRKDIAPDFVLEYRLTERIPFEQFMNRMDW